MQNSHRIYTKVSVVGEQILLPGDGKTGFGELKNGIRAK